MGKKHIDCNQSNCHSNHRFGVICEKAEPMYHTVKTFFHFYFPHPLRGCGEIITIKTHAEKSKQIHLYVYKNQHHSHTHDLPVKWI